MTYRLGSLMVAGAIAVALSGCTEETAFSALKDETSELSQYDELPADEPAGEPPVEGPGREPASDSKPPREEKCDRDERDRELDGEVPVAECERPNTRKVLICHVPAGNPAARKTICIARSGASHGHGVDLSDASKVGAHGGDRLGRCEDVAE